MSWDNGLAEAKRRLTDAHLSGEYNKFDTRDRNALRYIMTYLDKVELELTELHVSASLEHESLDDFKHKVRKKSFELLGKYPI